MSEANATTVVPVGRILERLRKEAQLTQEQVAEKVTFKISPAGVSRVEDGGKQVTDDELAAILKAIGTAKADEFAQYLREDWDQLERPPFDHPNRKNLWQANRALRKLTRLRDKPDLKGVFVRQIDLYERELHRVSEFLRDCTHRIAFIGCIGVGKSTGICKLANLLKPGEDKLDREIVLETGAGGITLCEVHITQGPGYGLRIEPRTRDAIEKDVEDLAEYLFKATRPDAAARPADEEEGDVLGISKEVVRAIRNMADLTEKRTNEGGRRVRVDPARELAAQYNTATELAIQILSRMALPRRSRRDLWYPEDAAQPPAHWLQQVFADVNNGRHPEVTLPARIEVIVPAAVFASEQLPLTLIDTKGVDQTAEREDLECHFDDPRTLVVLCSRFNDSPDLASQTLIQRAREAGVRDIEAKTALLVLARPDEALAVKHDGGGNVEDEAEGYELKKDQIDLRLSGLGATGLPVHFFNAKENHPEPVRNGLVGQIVAYRERYCDQIDKLAAAVDHLIKNQEDVTTRLVFEQVGQRLATWIDTNRGVEWPDLAVEAPLVKAIGETRYASTVRAAVRRQGHWPNLDYYHHLAHGARRVAVKVVGEKIAEFKVIVKNLLNDDELSPAREFLNRVVQSLDVKVDEAYRTLQLAGQKAYKDELEKDRAFWDDCDKRWGAKRAVPGGKYRDEIGDLTESRFTSGYEAAHKLLKEMVEKEWGRLVGILDEMLKEKGTEVGVAVKRK